MQIRLDVIIVKENANNKLIMLGMDEHAILDSTKTAVQKEEKKGKLQRMMLG